MGTLFFAIVQSTILYSIIIYLGFSFSKKLNKNPFVFFGTQKYNLLKDFLAPAVVGGAFVGFAIRLLDKIFFADVPFTWAIASSDHESIAVLEKNNMQHKGSFPAMMLDLDSLRSSSHEDEITIKKISLDNIEDVKKWILIVSQCFNAAEPELLKVIDLFKKQIPHSLKLYLGFYKENAVAASMVIQHQEIISLHWIGTLPEFRNRGLGFAITHKALLDAQDLGCKQAILLSSVLGKSLYEHIGFREYASYAMYGN
jgi:GNAT superfamily N-acetyltransferase